MLIKEKSYDYDAWCSWYKSDLRMHNEAILFYKLNEYRSHPRTVDPLFFQSRESDFLKKIILF